MASILCVIDSLGSGGAQRQIVNLAGGLKANGHQVEVYNYYPGQQFYKPLLDSLRIPIHEVDCKHRSPLRVVATLASLMRSRKYDAIVSFLPSPNIYSIVSKLISLSSSTLIVSERVSQPGRITFLSSLRMRFFLYPLASKIVVNSRHQSLALAQYSWLKRKVYVVYNGFSISSESKSVCHLPKEPLRFVVVGRIDGVQKNGLRLVQALCLFLHRNRFVPPVAWAGRQEQDPLSLRVRAEMDKLISANPALKAQWLWLGERNDIPNLLSQNHALIHVSLFEGLPNAICEAFIASRPVIASSVCDHPTLIVDGVRGFLCNPFSPLSICKALERFARSTQSYREEMGRNARKYAEKYLTIERMVAEYEDLLR